MKRSWTVTLGALFAAGALAHAEEAPAAAATPLGGSIWQIGLYLAGMVVFIVGGVWLMRNGLPSMQRNKGERKLNISETRGLGARQFLVVAEYESRKMLISVCPGRIDYLCTLSGSEPEFPKLAPEKPE